MIAFYEWMRMCHVANINVIYDARMNANASRRKHQCVTSQTSMSCMTHLYKARIQTYVLTRRKDIETGDWDMCTHTCTHTHQHAWYSTCCSVLQCVAVCCSVLQCVAVCCSVLQCVAVCCSVLHDTVRASDRRPCTRTGAHTHVHTHTCMHAVVCVHTYTTYTRTCIEITFR